MNQRVARFEQDARQPRLAMEADEPADMKTRERTEGAVKAVRAKHGDSCTAQRVQDGPKTPISFGVKAEPPALPCRDVVFKNGAVAPKSWLSPLEMRTTSAAGGLLSTGKTSTATKTTYNQPPLWLYSTGKTNSKKTNLRTPIPFVSYDRSFRRNKLLAAPFCRGVIETKYGQSRMFDPAGSQGHPRACPFLETWRALLCGEVMRVGAASDDLQRFWRIDDSRFKKLVGEGDEPFTP